MFPVLLIGGFIEILELCNACNREIVGIIDPNLSGSYYDIPVLGCDNDAEKILTHYKNCELVICPDDPKVRYKLVLYYSQFNCKFATLISPLARLSKYVIIGRGSIIQHDASVSAFSKIGDFVKLNYCCNVTHNVEIGNFVTIAPNAVLLGYVKLGSKCYIGANSTVLPHKILGNNVVIGAGAVVTKNVFEGATFVGNPARQLQNEI
jgi:sugar O-acyltransferase (sialic acid O-acetyltransferase NeuD family)